MTHYTRAMEYVVAVTKTTLVGRAPGLENCYRLSILHKECYSYGYSIARRSRIMRTVQINHRLQVKWTASANTFLNTVINLR